MSAILSVRRDFSLVGENCLSLSQCPFALLRSLFVEQCQLWNITYLRFRNHVLPAVTWCLSEEADVTAWALESLCIEPDQVGCVGRLVRYVGHAGSLGMKYYVWDIWWQVCDVITETMTQRYILGCCQAHGHGTQCSRSRELRREGESKEPVWNLPELRPFTWKRISKNAKKFGVTRESYTTSAVGLDKCQIRESDGPLQLKNKLLEKYGFLDFFALFLGFYVFLKINTF